MSKKSETSASGSGGTPPDPPQPARPSEADFLKREAEQARAAILRTLGEMADNLPRAADPGAWARRYPWWAVGAAAAAGFLLGRRMTGASKAAAATVDAPAQHAASAQTAGFFQQFSGPLWQAVGNWLSLWLREVLSEALTAPARRDAPAAAGRETGRREDSRPTSPQESPMESPDDGEPGPPGGGRSASEDAGG